MSFDTSLVLSGPWRKPRQMLAAQEYDGHVSIHDDAMAAELGFAAGPIEGPTHFSLFAPLLNQIWGREWFERGCFSAHYETMVIEGEETRAFVELPKDGASRTRAWAEKADGARVLEASASLGEGPTLLNERMGNLRPPGPLVILEDLHVGMKGAKEERVRMGAHQHMGALYPFSLADKLAVITEPSAWYADDRASPWGRAIIPFEMVSVLAQYSIEEAAFPVKGPAVGLIADQEIRMIEGPLFVDEEYVLRREIVALSESRRTESYWTRTKIFDATGQRQVAEMLLNLATVKLSYADYEAKRARR